MEVRGEEEFHRTLQETGGVHLQVGIFELMEQVGCASISSGAQCQTILEMQEWVQRAFIW